MSYIVKRLPKLKDLKEELTEFPERVKYYNKYGGYTGSSESMDYLIQKIKEYYEDKKD